MTTAPAIPEVNRELFTKIRDKIIAHPWEHNQGSWESSYCGTTRCTAGWAVHFTHPEDKSIFQTIQRPEYCELGFEKAGAQMLGLTLTEANYLFYASNSAALEMITHYAEHGREGWVFPADYDDSDDYEDET